MAKVRLKISLNSIIGVLKKQIKNYLYFEKVMTASQTSKLSPTNNNFTSNLGCQLTSFIKEKVVQT